MAGWEMLLIIHKMNGVPVLRVRVFMAAWRVQLCLIFMPQYNFPPAGLARTPLGPVPNYFSNFIFLIPDIV